MARARARSRARRSGAQAQAALAASQVAGREAALDFAAPAPPRAAANPLAGYRAALTAELDPKPRKVPLTTEVGAFGTKIFAGISYDEYLPALQYLQKFKTYEEMRRSDGQIRALLTVLKLPVRAARWTVESADPDDEEAEAQATFVEGALLEGMDQPWDDALREALLCCDYGFMLHERVYIRRPVPDHGDAMTLKYLAYRAPSTVLRWNTDPATGQLVSVTQLPPPTYDYRVMPVDKIVHYCPEQEGANFDGISSLRPAYKHWYIKNQLYKLQAVALARSGMGIPWIKLPTGFSTEDETKALSIVTTLATSEQAGLVIPNDWEVGVLTFPAPADFKDAIEHHDVLAARAHLAQFLNLGSGNVGSFALGESQAQLLLDSLNALAGHVANRLNTTVVRQLVDVNFKQPAQAGYPKLTHGDIGERDLAVLSTALASLATGGFLRPDATLEERLRELLGLPEPDPDTMYSVPAAPGAGMAGGPQDAGPGLQVGDDGSISVTGAPGGAPASGASNVVAPNEQAQTGEQPSSKQPGKPVAATEPDDALDLTLALAAHYEAEAAMFERIAAAERVATPAPSDADPGPAVPWLPAWATPDAADD